MAIHDPLVRKSSNTACHARTVSSDSSEAKATMGCGKAMVIGRPHLYCLTAILIAPRVELYGVKLADCPIPCASSSFPA